MFNVTDQIIEESPQRFCYKRCIEPNYLKQKPKINFNARVIENVPFPERQLLNENEIYKIKNKPSTKLVEEHFFAEGRIEVNAALRILFEAAELFRKEKNLLILENPITIAGDIHGQFYDLLTLFKVGGIPPRTKYLFNGDYVDRGYFSVECILYLFSLKINHPDKMFFIRGNHETRHLSQIFTFKCECEVKYGLEFYEACMETFDTLPLAALIDDRFLCMHGGISPNIISLNDIRNINRFREPPLDGAMCDILWADPVPDFDTNPTDEYFLPNTQRSISYYYSYRALSQFLQHNKLSSIIRAHEMQFEGFKLYRKMDNTKIPSLISIFSAPNYVDRAGKAAILKYENQTFTIKRFASVPHPYWLPNFENAISFTLPFVIENVTKILVSILINCIEGGYDGPSQLMSNRFLEIKKKIQFYGRVASSFSSFRKDSIINVRLSGGTRMINENCFCNNVTRPCNDQELEIACNESRLFKIASSFDLCEK